MPDSKKKRCSDILVRLAFAIAHGVSTEQNFGRARHLDSRNTIVA